jgi:hypothetical protein
VAIAAGDFDNGHDILIAADWVAALSNRRREMTRHLELASQSIGRRNQDVMLVRSDTFKNTNRTRVLVGWGTAVCVLAIIGFSVGRSEQIQALEATGQMERLAGTLSHVASIAPDTAATASQMLRRHEYDCARVACSPALANRNRIVRMRLEMLLKGPRDLAKR